MDNEGRAIELTENIGANMTDLEEIMEAVHYDPEEMTDVGIETLERINNLIIIALRAARKFENAKR